MRSSKELQAELDEVMANMDTLSTRYWGMGYADVVIATLEWVMGRTNDQPSLMEE